MKQEPLNITVAAITRCASVDFQYETGSFDILDTFILWAKEFDTKYKNTNWEKVDYEEKIESFVKSKIK
jgi:hypothetical protein